MRISPLLRPVDAHSWNYHQGLLRVHQHTNVSQVLTQGALVAVQFSALCLRGSNVVHHIHVSFTPEC